MQNAALNPDVSIDDPTHASNNDTEQQPVHPRLDTPAAEDNDADDATNGVPEDGQQENANVEPPLSIAASKKRKFAELNSSRSRSTSRAASPPWKAFAAEGPTQFTTDGKRRSGRVNHIPLELQPPSDKRQTRAAHDAAVTGKSEDADNTRRSSRAAVAPTVKRESRSSLAGKDAVNGTNHSPVKSSPVKPLVNGHTDKHTDK